MLVIPPFPYHTQPDAFDPKDSEEWEDAWFACPELFFKCSIRPIGGSDTGTEDIELELMFYRQFPKFDRPLTPEHPGESPTSWDGNGLWRISCAPIVCGSYWQGTLQSSSGWCLFSLGVTKLQLFHSLLPSINEGVFHMARLTKASKTEAADSLKLTTFSGTIQDLGQESILLLRQSTDDKKIWLRGTERQDYLEKETKKLQKEYEIK